MTYQKTLHSVKEDSLRKQNIFPEDHKRTYSYLIFVCAKVQSNKISSYIHVFCSITYSGVTKKLPVFGMELNFKIPAAKFRQEVKLSLVRKGECLLAKSVSVVKFQALIGQNLNSFPHTERGKPMWILFQWHLLKVLYLAWFKEKINELSVKQKWHTQFKAK